MPEFKFNFGETVRVCPVGSAGPRGRVVGRIEYEDGCLGYVVALFCLARNQLVHHEIRQYEVTADRHASE